MKQRLFLSPLTPTDNTKTRHFLEIGFQETFLQYFGKVEKGGVFAIPMILLRGGRLTPHVACESIIKRCLLPKAYFYLLDSVVYVFNKGVYTSEIDLLTWLLFDSLVLVSWQPVISIIFSMRYKVTELF